MKSHCLIGLSMVAFFVLAGRAETMLDLAVRGLPAAYTIVTRAQPSPVEEYAAEELQTFVEKTTGVKLSRQTDAQPLPARAILKAPAPKPPVAQPNGGVIEESAMMLHQVGKLSALVDDPLAADGRAVKILNARPDWCVELKFGRIHFKPNQKYRLRARMRVEKEGPGEAFQCHVYNRVVRASVCAVAKTTDQTTNAYEWYDVGTLVPNDSCSFWMGSGRFESGKGKRAVKAVYLDRIEFVPVP